MKLVVSGLISLLSLSAIAGDPPIVFPTVSALGAWSDTGEASGGINMDTYPTKAINCPGQFLYPTFPQQDLKQYVVSRAAVYDANKLIGSDRACLIAGKGKDKNGNFICVRGDIAKYVVISDLLQDDCGNLYRGFVEKKFLQQDETMGTLFSPGRTMYEDPKSDFKGNQALIMGDTYAVDRQEFIKIGPPLIDDLKKLDQFKQQALQSFTYDPATHLYKKIGE